MDLGGGHQQCPGRLLLRVAQQWRWREQVVEGLQQLRVAAAAAVVVVVVVRGAAQAPCQPKAPLGEEVVVEGERTSAQPQQRH